MGVCRGIGPFSQRGSGWFKKEWVSSGQAKRAAAQLTSASRLESHEKLGDLLTSMTGNTFRLGISLDFVWLTTRTIHPPWGVRAGGQTKSN